MLPGDFPPWQAVEQQVKRWMEAKCFETLTPRRARVAALVPPASRVIMSDYQRRWPGCTGSLFACLLLSNLFKTLALSA